MIHLRFLALVVLLAGTLVAQSPVLVNETWEGLLPTPGNVDSLAVWHRGDPSQAEVFLTDKEADTVEVFDATTGTHVATIGQSGAGLGQFERPNGVCVAYGVGPSRQDVLIVVERDNDRVQLLELPGYTPISTFGTADLITPYGCAVGLEGDAVMLYVTDKDGADGERIRKYRLEEVGGVLTGTLVLSFGPSTGPNALVTVESLVTDDATDRVFVCDETADDIKVFDTDGNWQTTFAGPGNGLGLFVGEPEGIVIYRAGSSGVIIVADQVLFDSRFNLYDLDTLTPLGTFTTMPAISRTDGIALTQRPLPPHETGLFYAVHDDLSMRAYGLDTIMNGFGLATEVERLSRDREGLHIAGGRCEFQLNFGPSHATRPYYLLTSASGTTPGFDLGAGLALPLNPDYITSLSLAFGNTLPQSDFIGTLDAAGAAFAALDLPPGLIPTLASSFDLHFAALLVNPPLEVSNAVPLEVLP